MTEFRIPPSELFSQLDERWRVEVEAVTSAFDEQFDHGPVPVLEDRLKRFEAANPDAPDEVLLALVADLLSIEVHRIYGAGKGYLPSGMQLESDHPSIRSLVVRSIPHMPVLDLLPERIEGYMPQEQIGRGGQAHIVTATKPDMKGTCSIIKFQQLESPHAGLILKEAGILSDLAEVEHPNIIRCLHSGNDENYAYLVLPYLPGQTLEEAGRLDPQSVIRIGARIADALYAIHLKHYLHCDVTPSNIRLLQAPVGAEPRPILIDFGLALRRQGGNWTKPKVRSVGGTAGFHAPEQLARDGLLDERTDLFQLGVTLGWALTGRDISEREAFVDALQQDHIPEPLRSCLITATALDPADRFHSARAMCDALTPQITPPIETHARTNTDSRFPRSLAAVAFTSLTIAAVLWIGREFVASNPPASGARDGNAERLSASPYRPETATSRNDQQVVADPPMSATEAQEVLDRLIESRDGSSKGQQRAFPILIQSGCDFVNSDLSGVSFVQTNLSDGNFETADLRLCNLDDSSATNARFDSAILSGASLSNAAFVDCDLTFVAGFALVAQHASFSRCSLYRANLSYSDLQDVDFSGADLTGACLSFCDLRRARFCGANLTNAYLDGSILAGSDFTDAVIDGTSFVNSVVGEGQVLSSDQMAGALLRESAGTPGIVIVEAYPSSKYDSGLSFREQPGRYLELEQTSNRQTLPVYGHPHPLPREYEPDAIRLYLPGPVLDAGARRSQLNNRISNHLWYLREQIRLGPVLVGDGSWQDSCIQMVRDAAEVPAGTPFMDTQSIVLIALHHGMSAELVDWETFQAAVVKVESLRPPANSVARVDYEPGSWSSIFPPLLRSGLGDAGTSAFRSTIMRRVVHVPDPIRIRQAVRLYAGETKASFVDWRGSADNQTLDDSLVDVHDVIHKDGSTSLKWEFRRDDFALDGPLARYMSDTYESTSHVVGSCFPFPGASGPMDVFFIFPAPYDRYFVSIPEAENTGWEEAEMTLTVSEAGIAENHCYLRVRPLSVRVFSAGRLLAEATPELITANDSDSPDANTRE
ncbi:MAG: serine/threonine-protein kinase [Planctomycetaceae bacterium]